MAHYSSSLRAGIFYFYCVLVCVRRNAFTYFWITY